MIDMESHLGTVVAQLKQGKVIPFLGAGANLCSRPEDVVWTADQHNHLPSGSELARYLAELHDFRLPDRDNLVRVAEYIALTAGEGPLYETLRELFDADYPPTALHEMLARMPRLLRDKGWVPLQLIVTTNYDDVLERAFLAEGEEVDVVSYMALGAERGHFIHHPPNGTPKLIEAGRANEYLELALDDRDRLMRPAILKIHGEVNRTESDRDSYVITEDDYIDYLIRSDISGLIPIALQAKLRRSNFLFLGYSLRDWNLRAILHRIWADQRARFNSWAIQNNPDALDRKAWEERGVDIMALPLDQYVVALTARLDELQPRQAAPNA